VVFDTSWQLLAQAEQAAFARLSVFRGKFTLQAAQRVADLTLPLLSTLVNKALLQREGDGRYSIHELLRQYAAEQLAAHPPLEAQLRGRHAGFYAAFLQARRGELQAERQGEALSAIAGQLENSLAGWEYALERLGDDDERLNLVDRYVDALFHFFDIRSQYRLGEELLRKAAMAVSTPTSPTDLPLRRRILLGKILSRQGWFLFHLGQVTQAQALLQQSAERLLAAGARAEAVFALNYLGALHRHQGDSVAARHCLNQSLTLCREINDRLGQSIALNILGQIAYLEEAYDEAQRFCHESLAIKRAIGDRWGAVFSLSYLGAVASSRGDLAEARRLIEESMAISHALGDRRGLASSLCALGELAQRQGHFQSAQHDYTQSLALYTEIHNLLGATVVRTRLGDLARQQDNGAEACGYLHEALATAQRLENLPQILEILLVVARLWRSLAGPATPLLQLLADHPVASKRQKSEAQALLAELAETAPRTQPAQPADLATEAALTTLINQTLGQLSRAISRTYA
jgi:tetratricopeptide (TPR) repeat protein